MGGDKRIDKGGALASKIRKGFELGLAVRLFMSRWIIVGIAALYMGGAFIAAQAEGVPDAPRSQDIQMLETCLNGIDVRSGESAERCLNLVKRGCESQ